MCGICGYAGVQRSAAPILREMLAKMEKYGLGYESAGMAIVHGEKIRCLKDVGSVDRVFPAGGTWFTSLRGSVGVGHVRFPSPEAPIGKKIFAHPFQSCNGKIVLVHNGTICSHKELLHELPKHAFSSFDETSNSFNDSEVIVHLLEEETKKAEGNIVKAVTKTCRRLSSNSKNQFLFAFINVDEPARIYVISGKDFKNERKIAVAFKKGFGSMFASYRDKGMRNLEPIELKALTTFVDPRMDSIEVLDYDTLAVLTSESYQLISLER